MGLLAIAEGAIPDSGGRRRPSLRNKLRPQTALPQCSIESSVPVVNSCSDQSSDGGLNELVGFFYIQRAT